MNTQEPGGVRRANSTRTDDISYMKHNNLMSKVLERDNS